MKRFLSFAVAVTALVGAASLHFRPVHAQGKATATNVPVIPWEAVPNFFKNAPGIYTGENMGIAAVVGMPVFGTTPPVVMSISLDWMSSRMLVNPINRPTSPTGVSQYDVRYLEPSG